MIITHKLEMDFANRSAVHKIDAVQGERNTRVLEFALKNGREDWQVPEGTTAAMRYCKSDGTKGYYDMLPDGSAAWEKEDNVIRFTLAPQMLTADGPVFAQMELLKDSKMLATFAVQIRVEADPAAGVLQSEDYINWLQWMEEELTQRLEAARDSGEFVTPVKYHWEGTNLVVSSGGVSASADLKGSKGDRGPKGETGTAAPVLCVNTPFAVIDLPRNETRNRYAVNEQGEVVVLDTLSGFSKPEKCPKYLGWRLEGDSGIYLFIGDMVNGEFVLDENYRFSVHGSKNLFNYMVPQHSRIVEIEEGKYFCYRISKDEGVTILGADTFPASEMDCYALAPNYFDAEGNKHVAGNFFSLVLPNDSYYAVVAEPGVVNVAYEQDIWDAGTQTAGRAVTLEPGPSFGYIPENAGAALLTVSGDCNWQNLKLYVSKPVKMNSKSGRRRKNMELAKKLIRDVSFVPKQSILWGGSANRHLEKDRKFYGVPYSSRWRNAHFVGFEVSLETALNALEDPYSIAYDGGNYLDANKVVQTWSVSGKTETGSDGGPGYGLVCSSFAALVCGNPYPQTNRGFTFDQSFLIRPAAAIQSGMVMVNQRLSHCVLVDEIFDRGYALLEGTGPCMAKTLHTNTLEEPSYLKEKTGEDFLDTCLYEVINTEISGCDSALVNMADIRIPQGKVRPWRGHKAVYGAWDKSENGTGIGITLKDGVTAVQITLPYVDASTGTNIRVLNVAQGTRYIDLAAWEENGQTIDLIRENGTYRLEAVGEGVATEFRYFGYGPVTLGFEADGKAVFLRGDGTAAEEIEYVYLDVTGYGGAFRDFDPESDGPVVIAAGRIYPDLAENPGRITTVYGAIAADPTEGDCWGKCTCLCTLR